MNMDVVEHQTAGEVVRFLSQWGMRPGDYPARHRRIVAIAEGYLARRPDVNLEVAVKVARETVEPGVTVRLADALLLHAQRSAPLAGF